MGKFKCNVQFQGKKANLIGYVSNDIHHDLLGLPWIRALQMLPKNFGRRSSPKTTTTRFKGQIGSKNAQHHAVGKKMAMEMQHRGNKTTCRRHEPNAEVRQQEPKSGIRQKEPTTFRPKEPIFLMNYRFGKRQWITGTILEQLNNSTTYRVHVPSLGCNVHRHKNQMRRQLDADWNNMQEPTIQQHQEPNQIRQNEPKATTIQEPSAKGQLKRNGFPQKHQ